MLVSLTGFFATVVCATLGALQVRHLWSIRRDHLALAGVSHLSPSLILATSVLWALYGTSIAAWPVVAMAAWDGLLAVGMLAFLRRSDVLIYVGVGGVIAALLNPLWLGIAGAAVSAVMFAPQAVRLWQVRGTASVLGYSGRAASVMVVGNVAWALYGAGIGDVLVAAPPVLHVASGAVILSLRAAYLRGIGKGRSHESAPPPAAAAGAHRPRRHVTTVTSPLRPVAPTTEHVPEMRSREPQVCQTLRSAPDDARSTPRCSPTPSA